MRYRILALYLLAVNALAFLMYGLDKRFAKTGKRRISERALLGVAACGGSLGAMAGMQVFHHKTLHRKFTVGVPLILAFHCLAAGLLLWVFRAG